MVGVPGRSRGCSTCKKRRIACDVQGPPCGQCSRSKRTCSFPQKHIFVLNDENSHKTIYRKKAHRSRQDANNIHKTAGPNEYGRDLTLLKPGDVETSSNEVVLRSFGSLTALKQQLVEHATAGNPPVTHEGYRGRSWTFAISAFADSAYALDSAPLACYTSWLGRRNQDPYLVEASQRLYVQGLREVQGAVNNTITALRDETFAGCLALIMYEAMECPDQSQRGYNVHVDGCSRLVKLRGASMHQEGASHNLFRTFRFVDILRAFETHRPSYLSSRAWITLPWQNHSKSYWDLLLDLLAEGPEILQKADKLGSMSPQHLVPTIMELMEELLALEHRMHAYYTELSISCSGPLFWESPPPITAIDDLTGSSQSPDPTTGIKLQFHDIEMARILTLYWAMLSMILSGLNDLWGAVQSLLSSGLLGQFQHVHGSLALEPRDWLEPVRNVCRSADYCKSDLGQGIGAVVIAAPLDIVLGVMKSRSGCSAEYAEAKRVREDISRNWLRVLQFSNPQL